jgi:hypothetical protein
MKHVLKCFVQKYRENHKLYGISSVPIHIRLQCITETRTSVFANKMFHKGVRDAH